jgi:polyisoprenoid-binding protein YceI
MTLTSGRYSIGPDDGELLVKTQRAGAAALVGHDLTLRAARWSASVTVDARGPERSSLSASVDARSLEVVEATGGAIGITGSQKDEIEMSTREKVLDSRRHRTITFASTAITGDQRKVSVSGNLTIRGTTRPAILKVRVDERPAVPRIKATTSIVQSDFGIKPYSALLGTLRVRDIVEVAIEVRLAQRNGTDGRPPPRRRASKQLEVTTRTTAPPRRRPA